MSYTRVTFADRPDLAEPVRQLTLEAWPEFLRLDAVCSRLWRSLFDSFAGFQLVLCDADDAVAAGHTIPLVWDGSWEDLPSGIDGVLERGSSRHNEAMCRRP